MRSDEVEIRVRKIVGGLVSGNALVSIDPISFLGDVDADTGVVIQKRNPLFGMSVKDAILIFPCGSGSTVGSYVIFALSRHGVAPRAIINEETETIIATGCVVSGITLVDRPSKNIFELVSTGDMVTVDADNCAVRIRRR